MSKFYVLTDNDHNILLKDGSFIPWRPILNLPDNVRKFTSDPGKQAEQLLPKGSIVVTVLEPPEQQ